jgi:hypothetical protein
MKPRRVKVKSVVEAMPTPPMMGIKESMTGIENTSFRKILEKNAAKTGSAERTICVKLTEPDSKAMTEVKRPRACKVEKNEKDFKEDVSIFGNLIAQKGRKSDNPTNSCRHETIAGRGKAFSAFLFETL